MQQHHANRPDFDQRVLYRRNDLIELVTGEVIGAIACIFSLLGVAGIRSRMNVLEHFKVNKRALEKAGFVDNTDDFDMLGGQ